MVDVHLDLDPWDYGRNAAEAGRLTYKAMIAAGYPQVLIPAHFTYRQLQEILDAHFPHETGETASYKLWLIEDVVFFLTDDDAQLFRGLLYLY